MWSTPDKFFYYISILGITYGLLATTMENKLPHIDKEREFTKENIEANISQQIS
jgi:hypothetical protein